MRPRTSGISNPRSPIPDPRSGAALIVALWVLIILSLLIGAFAFDMHIEAGITAYYRKRLRAQFAARAGVEYAKLVLARSYSVKEEGPEEGEDEETYVQAFNLSHGVGVSGVKKAVGRDEVSVDILPEQGRRNVNHLGDDDWEEVLDQANVPQELWPGLIDCYTDWVDANDEHQLNGAESDDAFYTDRGYECKNAPLDTVDELVLIKGFTPAIVFGGPPIEAGGEPLAGIAPLFTVWGDGKVNVNTASREVLLTLPNLEDFDVEDIMEGRAGSDGEMGTKDDGFKNVDEVIARLGLGPEQAEAVRSRITTSERRYVRVISTGDAQGVRSGIWCVLQADSGDVTPLFWREEDMP